MTPPSLSILGPIWGVSEFCLAVGKRSGPDAASRDRNSLRLIWFVNLAGIGLGVLAAYKLRGWALPWRTQFQEAGFCLFVPGLVLRWYAILYLGRFFTVNVAIAADHRLIDSGPYRHIRHPSYTGVLLMFLGIGLSIGNLASLLIMTVPVVGALLWRIGIEEAALLEALGEPYRHYKERTKRLVPLVY
jgi:protein-S-isoprenylcysteine O-methyltransferase